MIMFIGGDCAMGDNYPPYLAPNVSGRTFCSRGAFRFHSYELVSVEPRSIEMTRQETTALCMFVFV
jgi:hypothetical protein